MAGSSIPPPPPSLGPHEWKYDVFVSFRGEDTRKGFMSHLFHAFERADILCYRDTDDGQRGRTVAPMLLDAIHSSRIAIILFSTRYADSNWCLDELVEIMECTGAYRDHGHMVVPIFYGVEPRDVRRQTAEFGEGFKRCLAEEGEAKAAVWRAALEEAGKRSGWHLMNDANGDESELIDKIVGKVFSHTSFRNSPYFVSDSVGINSYADDVISLLDIGTDRVRTIGLFGIKGIGKTTLAKLVCSRVFSEFEGVSFLENIGDARHQSLVDFQKTLVKDTNVKHLTLHENDCNRNIGQIRAKLCRKKILLVLDDVRDKTQVDLLGGRKGSLGDGSRILITAQHEQLLDLVKVDSKYVVSGLGQKDSLQLFTDRAFGGDPEEGFKELSENLVHFAGGLPLAVETLGTCLYGRTEDQWAKLLERLVQNPNLDWIEAYSYYTSQKKKEAYSDYMDSFPLPPQSKVEPYGGRGGSAYDDKSFTGIRQMRIVVVGSIVESIYIDYDQNGSLVRSSRHGGPREGRTHTVMLDYPDEFLTSISGYITVNTNLRIIQSLSIHSNRRIYGPYGEEKGDAFSFHKEGGKILGFFGKCSLSFDSIGAHYGLISHPYPFKTIGPFGHKEGSSWDDGRHSDVRQINVVFNSVVESFSVIYDNYGHPTIPFKHGDQTEGKIRSVTLEYPYEFLTSISGYLREEHGKLILQSLSFHSNKNVHGPFGEETGIPFSGPSTGGKIVGFHGSCNPRLVSVGAYLEPVSHIHPVRSAGPFGGYGGGPWDDGKHTNIRKIVIRSGTVIDSIRCVYDTNGASDEQPRHGGDGGGNAYTVVLDPDEYITTISGYYGQKGALTVIKSLKFRTNKGLHGQYGMEQGTYFQSPPNVGKLVGFYGRSGKYLDSIGAYFAPVLHMDPTKTAGPYGGQGGNPWDDGKHTDLRRIFLSYGTIIDGIRCEYDESGESVSAEMHGGRGGNSYTIELDYPNEYLMSVSGYIGPFRDDVVIKSLKFRSNKRTFGPFGTGGVKPFSFMSSIGKIVGFSGRSNRYLNSIAAHLQIFPDNSL